MVSYLACGGVQWRGHRLGRHQQEQGLAVGCPSAGTP